MCDEKLSCNEHLNAVDNKVSKNTVILYKAKGIINTKGLRSLYIHLYIHS